MSLQRTINRSSAKSETATIRAHKTFSPLWTLPTKLLQRPQRAILLPHPLLHPKPNQATSSSNQCGTVSLVSRNGYRWGLIPFWTKRAPDFASIARTINCRDDSLLETRGMWNSIKGRKRCIVPIMGYYEWLKKGPKDKIPHFTKRADGKIMLLAGLWDSVQYEGTFLVCTVGLIEGTEERIYSYTIITTSSAKSVSFLHDRMPVILEPGSDEMKKWLDPNEGWSMELAKIPKPYEGKLEW